MRAPARGASCYAGVVETGREDAMRKLTVVLLAVGLLTACQDKPIEPMKPKVVAASVAGVI
jgi:hypothetical protein